MTFRCLWSTKVGPDQGRCREQCVTCAIHFKRSRMDFDTYLDAARETAIYPRPTALEYLALGLASEAGEIAGHIKKLIRDDVMSSSEFALELGDVLWYLAMLADECDLSLADIAQRNIEKLRDRQQRGQLQGSGDER